jgi:hypothetical protein
MAIPTMSYRAPPRSPFTKGGVQKVPPFLKGGEGQITSDGGGFG